MTPRRLASLLVIWISLFGMAVPAAACAMAARHANCCPDEGSPPCGECPDKAPGRSALQDHCLAVPGSMATSSATSEPVRKLSQVDSEPAILVSTASEPPSLDPFTEPIRHRWRPPHGSPEAPTYLITGRLRL